MIENLNIGAAAMLAQQQHIEVVSNNLANVNTFGYKAQREGFSDLLYKKTDRSQPDSLEMGLGSRTVQAGRAFGQGSLQRTDSPLDVGIEGPGFFTVKLTDGSTGLTRDGDLHVDAKGHLVNSTGAMLQPRVTIPSGTPESEIAIGQDGTITASGKKVGRINLVDVRAPQELRAAGGNAFTTTPESGKAVRANADTAVRQGTLEMSNVDTANEMVEMIDAQRAYTMASKVISTADEMYQIANGIKR